MHIKTQFRLSTLERHTCAYLLFASLKVNSFLISTKERKQKKITIKQNNKDIAMKSIVFQNE